MSINVLFILKYTISKELFYKTLENDIYRFNYYNIELSDFRYLSNINPTYFTSEVIDKILDIDIILFQYLPFSIVVELFNTYYNRYQKRLFFLYDKEKICMDNYFTNVEIIGGNMFQVTIPPVWPQHLNDAKDFIERIENVQ